MKNLGYYYCKAYYLGQFPDTEKVWEGNKQVEKPVIRCFDPRGSAKEGNTKFFAKRNEPFQVHYSDADLNAASPLKEVNSTNIPGIAGFELKTTYPGLLIGSGYSHETGSMEEFKLGFFFDHVTGMPLLPGSSVKGILRSGFPKMFTTDNRGRVIDKFARSQQPDNEQLAKARLIWWLFTGEQLERLSGEQLDSIHYIELEIFENIDKAATLQAREEYKDKRIEYLPTNGRDIFFDAFPARIINANFSGEKRLLGDDFITPHKHQNREKAHLDPFANPVPVKFMKVLPEVAFQFSFKLSKSRVLPLIANVQKKHEVFQELLLMLGSGAKTNVGYGQWSKDFVVRHTPAAHISNKHAEQRKGHAEGKPFNTRQRTERYEAPDKITQLQRRAAEQQQQPQQTTDIPEDENWISKEDVKEGLLIPATVLSSQNGNLKLRLHVKGKKLITNISGKTSKQTIQVRITTIEGKPDRDSFNLKVVPVF